MTKRPSFKTACATYVHRFTMEYVPAWSRSPVDGKHYAPQFRSDREWYENTKFPGEEGHIGTKRECFTTGQTWPLGQWLDKPFRA